MKTYKVKLKSLNECLKGCEVYESSDNYWKVVCKKDHKLNEPVKDNIGFRTFYKGYFGDPEKIVNVKEHKKFKNILQMYSDKGMHMMDIFRHWVSEWVEEEDVMPVFLTGLLEKWDYLSEEI
jgi:hypothetical protein